MTAEPLPFDKPSALLDGLNPVQREALTHPGGPILVVAGAGSGKTRVLTHRGAHPIRALTPYDKKLAEVFAEYQKRLTDASALDFDDLLTSAVNLFRSHPDVASAWRSRFAHVLVDEFQDTNVAQWELVRTLAEEHRNIMVVGDADQAIYRFRGADFRNLARFEEAFPDASVIVLEQNYRSTQTILDAANAVIANNAGRRPKHLWTDSAGGELICRYLGEDEHDAALYLSRENHRLGEGRPHRYGGRAVFYRTNAQSRVLEEVFVRNGIPYRVVGGVKFYDRREVKDALAYLRALANPDDEVSLKRIVNVPKRGVGDTSVAKVEAYSAERHLTFGGALARAMDAGVSGKALGGIRVLLDVLEELADVARHGVGDTVEAVLERTGDMAQLEAEQAVEAARRVEDPPELGGVGP